MKGAMSMSSTEEHKLSIYRSSIRYIEAICHALFDDIGSHGWEHVERVRVLCHKIGMAEGADLIVLDLAALFHDIIRLSEDHALQSAKFARSVLSAMGFEESLCNAVHEAIAFHSYSSGKAPQSLEAKVLSDADRIDAMGAIGIYRTIQYNTENVCPPSHILSHIREKLLRLPSLLFTEAARKMAQKRVPILEYYLRCLEEELLETSISK